MKSLKLKHQRIQVLTQKCTLQELLVSKSQLKAIKGGSIVEENAEGF